jgi:molybdopterin-binding protein
MRRGEVRRGEEDGRQEEEEDEFRLELDLRNENDRARVRLATAPPLVAEVTLGSVERLRLRSGVEVWASFKAVEVELLPP